jgi:hypothetical protein
MVVNGICSIYTTYTNLHLVQLPSCLSSGIMGVICREDLRCNSLCPVM